MQIGGAMQKKGFTLVEVLAVVLIVAILTAVALPQYRNVRERAKIQRELVRLRMIYDASEQLAINNGYRNFQSFASAKQTEYWNKYSKNYPFFQKMGIFDEDEFSHCDKLNSTISLKCGEYMFTVAPTVAHNYGYVEMYEKNGLFSIKLYRGNPPKMTCGVYRGTGTSEDKPAAAKLCEIYGIGAD